MGDKAGVLYLGNLMDIFYNHLSAFSADSTPHLASHVGNKKNDKAPVSPRDINQMGDEVGN